MTTLENLGFPHLVPKLGVGTGNSVTKLSLDAKFRSQVQLWEREQRGTRIHAKGGMRFAFPPYGATALPHAPPRPSSQPHVGVRFIEPFVGAMNCAPTCGGNDAEHEALVCACTGWKPVLPVYGVAGGGRGPLPR